MSWFTGDEGTRYELFGSGGGQALATEVGVPLMARIPLLPLMREGADRGEPVTLAAPRSEATEAFSRLAEAVEKGPSPHPLPPGVGDPLTSAYGLAGIGRQHPEGLGLRRVSR